MRGIPARGRAVPGLVVLLVCLGASSVEAAGDPPIDRPSRVTRLEAPHLRAGWILDNGDAGSASFRVEPKFAQFSAAPGAQGGYLLLLEVTNSGAQVLEDIALGVLRWSEGRARSFRTVALSDLEIAPGATASVLASLPDLEILEGDEIVIEGVLSMREALARQQSTSKIREEPPTDVDPNCMSYCQSCANLASQTCTLGVKSMNCNCRDDICQFECK